MESENETMLSLIAIEKKNEEDESSSKYRKRTYRYPSQVDLPKLPMLIIGLVAFCLFLLYTNQPLLKVLFVIIILALCVKRFIEKNPKLKEQIMEIIEDMTRREAKIIRKNKEINNPLLSI